MKYLIKDLSKITGLSSARIRKWQERYNLLRPHQASNGYHYYSNEDLLILNQINRSLDEGESLSSIISRGRDEILKTNLDDKFSEEQLHFISLIAQFKFGEIAAIFDKKLNESSFQEWVEDYIVKNIEIIGEAWSLGYLSIADEHAFSRWFMGYFETKIADLRPTGEPEVLVVAYPKDEHELGALLRYGILLSNEINAKFCGNLPEEEIVKELHAHPYKKLSVSMAIPRKKSEIENFRKRIQERFKKLKIEIGGAGYAASK